MTPDRRQRSEFGHELDPNILPRHRRALEAVAARLEATRPRPEPGFRATLDSWVQELAGEAPAASAAQWRLAALVAVVVGVGLLLIASGLAL